MDIRLALLVGADIPIPECQLTLHQPSMLDIARMGEEDFFKAVQCLSVNKSMISSDKDVLDTINNFQVFMTVINEKEMADKKIAVQQLLMLIFPSYNVMFSPKSLIFQNTKDDSMSVVDEANFEALQEIIKLVFCAQNGPMDQQQFNPADEKAREIAEKLMRGRKRVAELNGSADTSIFSQYLSSLSIGLHLSLIELKQYTMFQLLDAMERYSLYTSWDIDIRSRLAGAQPNDKPDNWMKNIH